MTRTLQRHGNSLALVIDKTLLEQLGIGPDTPLNVTVTGGVLTVAPVGAGVPRDEVADTLARLRPRYKKMLENLAK
jgi:antitoxin component of MazEF toxin-antitoxin module